MLTLHAEIQARTHADLTSLAFDLTDRLLTGYHHTSGADPLIEGRFEYGVTGHDDGQRLREAGWTDDGSGGWCCGPHQDLTYTQALHVQFGEGSPRAAFTLAVAGTDTLIVQDGQVLTRVPTADCATAVLAALIPLLTRGTVRVVDAGPAVQARWTAEHPDDPDAAGLAAHGEVRWLLQAALQLDPAVLDRP